ncbi:GGDEF domain-containing response regulator [Solemya velum gill symbiont]|uniref:GGDEF domain-containing response regulator n=1 Tax=Solemya velum gill symbiont TaxID=2340 RepID=UPI0009977F2C|nr:diguanylate cyclase [Solemya velum gill symbiont]OOZ45054.1 diguanylate cyclase response regulator [Solemya velum gill symbiont]OOZ47735.1 diguanylate cyclase response regulator [Solemya velum gill symbiont]OOZ50404.1 diguanylate cyclase response regulator [Solemya velum gill symbiont]OOZ52692.1 diguanylate cyclase response regulator [Solemya velum gill symbiont]OOZ55899.1 diguanylate cyclase response regulator [Solemya velum gill symbiont]
MHNQTSTILLVDDAKSNIDMVLNILGDQYDILVSRDGETALEIAAEEDIDLVLLDIMMPGMDGYQVCEALKADEEKAEIPVIFITAKTDENSIEKGFDVGGVDYVTKPFKDKELRARVKTHLQLRSLIKHLEYISSYDKMTGIYNRGEFFRQGEIRWKKGRSNLFAVMMDIDKFKTINDTYGHPTGDKVIKAVTSTVSSELGEGTIFGRVGGEEFTLLCNAETSEEVIALIEQIRLDVEKIRVESDDGQDIKCTISVGIAEANEYIESLDHLLKIADMALYDAKEGGRNRSIFREYPPA